MQGSVGIKCRVSQSHCFFQEGFPQRVNGLMCDYTAGKRETGFLFWGWDRKTVLSETKCQGRKGLQAFSLSETSQSLAQDCSKRRGGIRDHIVNAGDHARGHAWPSLCVDKGAPPYTLPKHQSAAPVEETLVPTLKFLNSVIFDPDVLQRRGT